MTIENDLTLRENNLVQQIYENMVARNILTGEPDDKGIEKSELNILAYHMKIIVMEDISDMLKNKAKELTP